MSPRVIEDSRSSKLVEPFIRDGVAGLPLRQRTKGDLSPGPFGRDQTPYQVLHCDGPNEIEFSSEECCGVIAISDGDIKIRKEFRTVFDGYMPTGTLCFMASAKSICFDPHTPLSMIVLSANRPQIDTLISLHDMIARGNSRSLDDFNIRSADLLELSSSLSDAAAASAKFLALRVFEKILMIGTDSSRPQKLPWWRLRRVKEYVLGNISGKNCLPELAEVAGLSRMHFAAQFKAATCLSPHEFVLRERSKAAAAMLSKSAIPIIEIALSVGFQNQAHFSTVFKALMGVTPATFRRSSAQQGREANREPLGL